MTASIIALVAVALLSLWVLRPLFGRGRRPPSRCGAPDIRRAELLETKYAVYRSILDLEFDRELGKVAQADYQQLRREHEEEAIDLLRTLDDEGALAPAGSTEADAGALDLLEREIAAARQRRSGQ